MSLYTFKREWQEGICVWQGIFQEFILLSQGIYRFEQAFAEIWIFNQEKLPEERVALLQSDNKKKWQPWKEWRDVCRVGNFRCGE